MNLEMTTLLVLLCVALVIIITVQIGKVTELASKLRGEEEAQARSTNTVGRSMMLFMIGFLILTAVSMLYYKNWFLGYGPHESASEHGSLIDDTFALTFFFTYIVFVITHVFLFYYAYRYRYNKNRRARFISHNNTIEIVWTVIPAVVMTFLVVGGLDAWNEIMGDVAGKDQEFMEIEATGYQFAWELRYPGPDGKLGRRDFRMITGVNNLGQDWTDEKNHDDFKPAELVLPVGKKVRVRIMARDVLHDFYLPHFRVKMDAVPGIPTYFVFTPEKTTEEYRTELAKYPEYQQIDPKDDDGRQLWETFEYELACAELCGIGHFSMRKVVRIVTQEEYEKWLLEDAQKSTYFTSIRGTEFDPLQGELLQSEIKLRSQEFNTKVTAALATPEVDDDVVVLDYVTFETGLATLTPLSRYQLDDVVEFLAGNPSINILLGGHTDSTGDAAANMALSAGRAASVRNYLLENGVATNRMQAQGFGSTKPIAPGDTEEGRQQNRRTDFTLIRTTVPTTPADSIGVSMETE